MKTLAWNRYSHHLPLVGAVMIFSYIAIHQYNTLSDTRHFVRASQTSTAVAIATQKQELGKVSDLELFGKNTAPVLSQPNSNIKIDGIFMATPTNKSTVALTVNNENEKLYKAGDKIKGNGQITRIAEEYILVLHNGRTTKYLLTMQDTSAVPVTQQTGPRTGWEPEPTAMPNNNVPAEVNEDSDDALEPTALPGGTTQQGYTPPVVVPGETTQQGYTPPVVAPGQLPNGYQNDPRMHQYFRGKGRSGGGF